MFKSKNNCEAHYSFLAIVLTRVDFFHISLSTKLMLIGLRMEGDLHMFALLLIFVLMDTPSLKKRERSETYNAITSNE